MSNLLIINQSSPDDGLDYIFGKMYAIYGQTFIRHWQDVDSQLMRQVWTEELGDFLKSKDILDHALKNMDGDFPPSVIKFRQLCKSSREIYDLDTRIGIEKLAEVCKLPSWDEMEHWHIYKDKVIQMAKSMGLV